MLILRSGMACLLLGVIIGCFFYHRTEPLASYLLHQQMMDQSLQRIMYDLNKENIRAHLKAYTSKQRLAGTEEVKELVRLISQQWRDNGLDKVMVTPYDVLLSYPNISNPNKGDLVYVNYGRLEDFQYLKYNLSIDLTNKIVIARYGKMYRGDKVLNAQHFNCSGIILYRDPADCNLGKLEDSYPNSWWMPDTGVQQGSIGTDGDFLTPLYPAKDYAHRLDMNKVVKIKIPCQPISYGDALHFLRELGGVDAPEEWQGNLPMRYKIGSGFSNKSKKVRLTVNNYLKVETVENVIGIITGNVEPDRYVLLGNHHDAWAFGAIDPLSGTAALTEITRVIGNMKREGIRPRRTIIFCTWGGEEVGLLGSTEWVEEYMKVLYERAVAYINVDYAVDYIDTLVAGTSPLLHDPLYHAAKMVPNPDPTSSYKTLYDIWNKVTPGNGTGEPSVYYSLGASSDMATFYQRAGVPSVDMWYTFDRKRWDLLSFPLYHSAYETFHMYETFIDPSFNYTLGLARLWGVMSWKIADETVFSFDVRRYAKAISDFLKLLKIQYGTEWRKHNINIAALEFASMNLTTAAQKFHEHVQMIDRENPLTVRMANDKMIQLERAFIDPEGLPGRPFYKHVMFAPSKFDSYKDNTFPGIVDAMYEIQYNNANIWDELKQQVYVSTYTIQSAANTLDPIGFQ
ncbi:hypothetical protein ACJMK2_028078 [Sinanodonta woodiana]|uniref:Aminopeptidase NAALADL1 n=1 Tax=Sinanodonta woodiana TaxID=1069815 RepID=A0ABD3X9V8_SINWO